MINKLNSLFLLIAIILISGKGVNAQSVASPYEVGTWIGFRSAAICYTFDDGCSNQFNIAVPEFNKYDFKLTLFTVINWSSSNWTKLQSAASSGHEIGSHTLSHPHLELITDTTNLISELKDSKADIESHITGQKCLTIAYPYCTVPADSMTKRYYISARGCQGFIEPSTPGSFMNVSSIICGNLGSVQTIDNFKTRFHQVDISHGWCVFLIHGIDNDGGYSPLQSSVLKNSLLFLSYRKSKFWVTTFRNASLYAKERNAANVIETTNLDTIKIIQVSDTLSDSIFNLPLTIRRPLPADWPSAIVKQGDTAVYSRIVQIDTTVYLAFDVVPDGSDVKILKSNDTIVPSIDTIPPDSIPSFTGIKNINEKNSSINDLKIWITNDILNFSVPTRSGMNLVITLYDMTGRNLALFKVKRKIDGTGNIQLPKNILKSNGYIVSITDGTNLWSKQIMLL